MKPFLYGLAGAIVALVGTASFQARASMSPSDLQPLPTVAAPPVQTPAVLAAPPLAAHQVRIVPVSYEEPAPVRRIVRRDSGPRRNWARTALVIGGSAGTGAGVGGLAGGKKGALIGAAIGGGAATLFEAMRK